MPSTTLDAWSILGLLAFSITVTLAASWAVALFRRPAWPRGISCSLILSLLLNLVWILLIFLAGIIATRYIDRLASGGLAYLAFGFVALLFSFIHALLLQRIKERSKEGIHLDRQALLHHVVHTAAYLLFAAVLYLGLSLFLGLSVEPILLLPLWTGALLPDLDSQDSVPGHLLPFVSRPLETRLGSRQQWHTLAANAFVALITSPLVPVAGILAWYPISLGFFSHLALDLLAPPGIMLFWPASRKRYSIRGGAIGSPGRLTEAKIVAVLAFISVLLLLVVDIGPPPPVAAPVLSYEQTLERYHSVRGNNLVSAAVEGTWQASGRRMAGRFEILNVAGATFFMLDRYDGSIFTAGRGASDHLYLNRISLETGPSAVIKPVEIHVENQRLVEALPVVYEMQREPGLQHIYVSGDVIVPNVPGVMSPTLPVDYAQTSVRRIQAHDARHYSFHYLPASDLIKLADLAVETADLLVVATYASPANGPTVTPLPSPPATPEPTP